MKLQLMALAIGCVLALYGTNQLIKEDAANEKFNDEQIATLFVNDAIKELNVLNSSDVPGRLNILSSVDKNTKAYLDLKLTIIGFQKGQELFAKAIELQTALSLDESGVPHPLVINKLKEAIVFFEEAKAKCDNLDEGADNEYNFILNYTKGEIYYRYLQFLGTPETALELFNQTVTYYRNALTCKPRDINTVINVEILIKEKSKLLAMAANPDSRKQQILNPKFGIGKNKGN